MLLLISNLYTSAITKNVVNDARTTIPDSWSTRFNDVPSLLRSGPIVDQDTTNTPMLTLQSPNGGEEYFPGTTVEIRWQSQLVDTVLIEFSSDNGATWTKVADFPAFFGNIIGFGWTTPQINSNTCLVRLSANGLTDQSDAPFEIAPSTGDAFRIVVLGSSTAVGVGTSTAEKAWVRRYNRALQALPEKYEVFNLARSATGTYTIMPNGTPVPPQFNFFAVDTSRNITKALSLNPDAIIVNMPSNDAQQNVPATIQMDNFRTIVDLAEAAGIPTWVCTPQPRNFSATSVQIQRETRDSVLATFGDRAINFWKRFADSNGFISPRFDPGDGIHLNDIGHRILFKRVLAAAPHASCPPAIYHTMNTPLSSSYTFRIAPNPFIDEAYLELDTQSSTAVSVTLTDMAGQVVGVLQQQVKHAGKHRLSIKPVKTIREGFIIAHITLQSEHGVTAHKRRLILVQSTQ